MAGVSMEADGERIQECLRALFAFLAEHGGDHGIDGSRVGTYAASANVSGATEYLLGEGAAPGVRAAVLYYGQPPQRALRRDLPVLFVLPQSDAQGLGPAAAGLWQTVLESAAPWTLAFGPDLPHAFDAFTEGPLLRGASCARRSISGGCTSSRCRTLRRRPPLGRSSPPSMATNRSAPPTCSARGSRSTRMTRKPTPTTAACWPSFAGSPRPVRRSSARSRWGPTTPR